MSVKAMAWAWELPDVSSTEVLVLVALADHADHKGICWPGQDGIAIKCRLSRETVNRAIKRLEERGHLFIENRRDPLGRPVSNYYRLSLKVGGNVTESHTGYVTDDHVTVTDDHTNHHKEPSEENRHKNIRTWPDEFSLTAEMKKYAEAVGVDADAEFEAWRDDCAAHQRRYSDWGAAWRTRIRNVPKFAPRSTAIVKPAVGGLASRPINEVLDPDLLQTPDQRRANRDRLAPILAGIGSK
jgi:hypothetical protein